MGLKEIIELEGANTDRIFLHREGLFWKAYERSAFQFVKQYADYKVLKRHYKVVCSDVVSLGFPHAVLHKLFSPDALCQVDEKQYCAACNPIDEAEYARWHGDIPRDEKVEKTEKVEGTSTIVPASAFPDSETLVALKVIARLREFRVETSTPMDCINFVSELKKIIS